MKIDLSGKSALVCGASQGIGEACAQSLAACGANVTLVARSEQKLKEVVKTLPSGNHQIFLADLSNKQQVQKLVDHISKTGFDILINNTGGPQPGPITDASLEEFENGIQAHLFASHQLVQASIPTMKAKGFGRIINIISTSVKIPIPGLGVSNTIRGAMASWAKSMSNELAQHGITVNNILPGLIETPRLMSLIEQTAKQQELDIDVVSENFKSTVPSGRFGQPSEIGNMVAFLASEYGAYINGTSIPVDGGRTGAI